MKFKIIVMAWLIAVVMSARAQSPAWWFSRGAVDTNLQANDYAPITCGQLKWLATNASCEMNAYFGAGTNVTAVVSAFSNTNNYYLANIGQLKYIGKPFYDRLYELDLANTLPANMPGYYPWGNALQTNEYALANIGQAKYVFSFDSAVDSDGDGLNDWQEAELGTNPYNPDSDGDGLSDKWEIDHGLDPLDWDTDGDGLSDGWELAHGYDPLNSSDGNETLVREAARQNILRHWMLFNGWRFEFTNAPGSAADLNDLKWALNLLSCDFYKVEFTYEITYYHLNRKFTPISIYIEGTPTVYQLHTEAEKLTDIVQGLALQFDTNTNGTYAIERNAAAICYTTAADAWNAAVAYNNGTPSNYPVKIYDNCGWVRGTKATNGEWGAYFWTLQNHLAFRTSESNWWRHINPTGVFVAITNVFVGSIGNFPAMTDTNDTGPHLILATNFPGADCGEVKEYKVDITNIFYQLSIPDIWITPREAKTSVGGTNIQYTVIGTNIPTGVTWALIPDLTNGAGIQSNSAWQAEAAPGDVAANYKVRATSKDNTNFYDEAVLKVYKIDIVETNVYVAVSNTVSLHLTADSTADAQWEIVPSVQSGAVIQGSSAGTSVVINSGSIPTNYIVKAYASEFTNCYDLEEFRIIKVEKIPLGGTNNLSECIMGKVYVPTKWGGNLKLSGGSVNLYYTDGTNLDDNTAIQIFKGEMETNYIDQGNPCEYTVPANQFKWFYVKSSSSAPTAITANFEQIKTVSKSPWDCPWYPFSDEQSTNNLYDPGECLAKYDSAFNSASLNQEKRNIWIDGDYVAKDTLDEQDAERTLGYDLDNADSDNDVWTGWDTNVAYDIWNSAQDALGQDGLTNATGDVSWWGHCDMATAVIICENEPTGDYTTNGVVFTSELKKGLLVALYHGFEYLYDSGTNVLPHTWQQTLEEKLISSNTMVGCDVYYPDSGNTTNQVWNYPIYEITKAEYKEKTNQTDETTVEINCELKYWNNGASSLYYRYNVIYNNNGVAFSSTTNDWLEHPLAQENHKRPDVIWMPKVKTTVNVFWGGQLNYSTIRGIIPEP